MSAGAGAGSVTSASGGGKGGGDVQPLPAFIAQGKLTMTRQAADANRNLTGIETREAGAISGSVINAYFKVGLRMIAYWVLLYCVLCILGIGWTYYWLTAVDSVEQVEVAGFAELTVRERSSLAQQSSACGTRVAN